MDGMTQKEWKEREKLAEELLEAFIHDAYKSGEI